MPVNFRIFSEPALVYVRYDGYAWLQETIDASQACAADPRFRPTLPHLFDFSGVTGYEMDFGRFFKLQADLLEMYVPLDSEMLAAIHAPNRVAQEMAKLAKNFWDPVPGAVLRVMEDFDIALDFLGVSQTQFQRLLAQSD
ncbi:MAG: hypothetical protein AAGL89_06290 [Pseudomonadota bacterium]